MTSWCWCQLFNNSTAFIIRHQIFYQTQISNCKILSFQLLTISLMFSKVNSVWNNMETFISAKTQTAFNVTTSSLEKCFNFMLTLNQMNEFASLEVLLSLRNNLWLRKVMSKMCGKSESSSSKLELGNLWNGGYQCVCLLIWMTLKSSNSFTKVFFSFPKTS